MVPERILGAVADERRGVRPADLVDEAGARARRLAKFGRAHVDGPNDEATGDRGGILPSSRMNVERLIDLFKRRPRGLLVREVEDVLPAVRHVDGESSQRHKSNADLARSPRRRA
jgi:hypothetical protein